MFAIEMLPALHGDALVVDYGPPAEPHRLLIDAGSQHSWPQVRARLLARRDRRYDAFVVTHVDEDHIGGAIELLDDPDLRHRVSHIWFNGYVHIARGGSVLGPVHGEQLTERIVRGPYLWNEPFPRSPSPGTGGPIVVPSAGDLPIVDLPGGARIVLLTPSGRALAAMDKVWKTAVEKAHLVPGAGTSGLNRSPEPVQRAPSSLPKTITRKRLESLAGQRTRDRSAANGSSIAFVVEYGRKRLLLGADAHSDQLIDSLVRYGEMVGEVRPRIDVFKLPHHGSAGNLTADLVAAVDCRRYLVSTSGHNFSHPDDAALARAILGSTGPVTIACNYDSPRTRPWVARGSPFGATVALPATGRAGLRVRV